MGNESTVPVQRGPKGNKVQPGLRIILMERLYPGSPRWNTQTEEEHTHKLFPGGSDDPNREPAVVEAIEEAWGKASLGAGRYSADANGSSSQQLCARSDLRIQTCVDPNCSRRSQEKYDPSVSFHLDQCAKCGKPTRYDYLRRIRNKWIYVFRGDPGGAVFEDEIFAQDENNWLIWNRPGVVPRSDRDFIANQQDLPVGNQYYTIEPGKLYQFFLSPVQLSKNALRDLNDAANKKPQSPPKNAVIDRNPNAEQLDSITVRRKFFAPEVTDSGSRTEIVGVMDAWSWLEEVNDWDYRPIIEAQLQFLMNPNEGTKLNIAVILNNLVAPAGGAKRDQFNLSRDMSDGCEKLESKTRAEAWVKQYEKTKTFLATEAEKACMRLNEWRTSKGHQIIETACQEELDMPGLQFPFTSPLAWGIAHYANILRDVMGCPFGEAILTGLATHEIERLPYRFVLYPGAAEQQELRRVRQDIGDLSLNILALFSPLIIRMAEENREAEVFVGHLKKLGVTATVPAKVTKGPDTYDVYKPIKVIKDSIIKVKEERLAAAALKLLPPPKPVDAPKTYYDKLKLYSTWETRMTDLVDLWIAAKACDAENPYETNVDRVRTAKSRVQYVTKLAGFTNKQTKALFSYYAQRHFKFDVGKWCEKYGHPTKEVGHIDIRALEASEGSSSVIISKETVELVEKSSVRRFSAMVRLYRGLEVGAKFLSRTVALL